MLSRVKHLVYSKNLLYSAATYPLVVWALGHLVWRGIWNRAYLRCWGQRFGFVPRIESGNVIWVHAVSVGEVRTVARLVEFLKSEYSNAQILISTMTPTGIDQVKELHGDSILHCYVPYDMPGAVQRFLDRTHPRLALIIETELWPNILRLCDERGIPILLVNARVSRRSFRGYTLFPRFMRTMLERPAVMAARSKYDAERLVALGANTDRVRITGNLKFDVRSPPGIDAIAESLRIRWGKSRPVWIAASTHPGEEAKVLVAMREIRTRHPDSLLVIVPRHPERFAKVERQCRRAGYEVALHSEARNLPATTDILIGDSMGELAGMYAAADVAFVGGSLVRHGRHHLVEAMAVGTPIVFGPHFFNFEQSSHAALDYGAAEQVRDPAGLAAAVSDLLSHPRRRADAAAAARRVIANNQGSLEATQTIIRETVDRCIPFFRPAQLAGPCNAKTATKFGASSGS